MALTPCPACQRHVYTTETICPFCQHELGALDEALLKRAPAGRMSRAALVVLGMSSVACGGDTDQSGDDTTSNSGPTTGAPNTTGTTVGPSTTGTNGGSNTTGTTAGPSTTGTGSDTNSTTSTTVTDTSSLAVQSAYGSPSIGFTTTGEPSGSGGTTSTDGGSMGGGAGEAGDVGGAGGNTSLPVTGGQPAYGGPPTPW